MALAWHRSKVKVPASKRNFRYGVSCAEVDLIRMSPKHPLLMWLAMLSLAKQLKKK